MNFWFTLREGLKGFRRARLATIITITSIAFALLLLGFFAIFVQNVDALIGDFRSQFEMLMIQLGRKFGIRLKPLRVLLLLVTSIK